MFYPIMVNLNKRGVIIFGGGNVAFRKVKTLIKFYADITIVSNSFIDQFEKIKDKVKMINDSYSEIYINDKSIVIAATSEPNTNRRIADYCNSHNILCNTVDDINSSTFITPAVMKRGDLVISVSTNGKFPILSKQIREQLEAEFDEEYIGYLILLGELRRTIINNSSCSTEKETLLQEVCLLSTDDLKLRISHYENKSRK